MCWCASRFPNLCVPSPLCCSFGKHFVLTFAHPLGCSCLSDSCQGKLHSGFRRPVAVQTLLRLSRYRPHRTWHPLTGRGPCTGGFVSNPRPPAFFMTAPGGGGGCKGITPPPPLCVTFRRAAGSLQGPGRSPVRPFACCVGALRSVGRCGRCSCWCCFRIHGAQWFGVPGLCWSRRRLCVSVVCSGGNCAWGQGNPPALEIPLL